MKWWNKPQYSYGIMAVAVVAGTLVGNFAFRV